MIVLLQYLMSNTSAFLLGTILIGSEQITYTGKTSTTLTGATRGANSTSAASHTSGVANRFYFIKSTS